MWKTRSSEERRKDGDVRDVEWDTDMKDAWRNTDSEVERGGGR